MASGLPVIASDLPVHREICQEAAIYFPRFSPAALAKSVVQVATSPEAAARMRTAASDRVRQFSWKKHVEAILELARSLMKGRAISG